MKIQSVKGTRDFYPGEMRLRNWIVDAWRRVSLRNGFEEYDAPIFEYLDLFTVKSGQEIAGQLFSFTDRGGRSLAIRPEITPSLARMVNAKIHSLPRPIKWFSVPRLCRAERPQRGRLREFFQWNVDVIGSDEILADAECILTAVDFLREVGLTPSDVSVRIGSRALTVGVLRALQIRKDQDDAVLAAIDKAPKVSKEEYVALATKAGLGPGQTEVIEKYTGIQLDMSSAAVESLGELSLFFDGLAVASFMSVPIARISECIDAVRNARVTSGRAPELAEFLRKHANRSGDASIRKGVDFATSSKRGREEWAEASKEFYSEAFVEQAGLESEIHAIFRLFDRLDFMGVADYCRLDLRIVRGLAYYTGIVYEIFDESETLRAVAGGGRYDNLLEVLGGPAVGACGFGMGDVVLGILLDEKGKVPQEVRGGSLDFFVIDGAPDMLGLAAHEKRPI